MFWPICFRYTVRATLKHTRFHTHIHRHRHTSRTHNIKCKWWKANKLSNKWTSNNGKKRCTLSSLLWIGVNGRATTKTITCITACHHYLVHRFLGRIVYSILIRFHCRCSYCIYRWIPLRAVVVAAAVVVVVSVLATWQIWRTFISLFNLSETIYFSC